MKNNSLTVTLNIELKKVISKTKNKVLLVIIAIISFFAAAFSRGGMSVNIRGFSLNFYNGSFMVLDALNIVVLPLTVFMLCADIISHEFSDSTIKAGLLRPVSKTTLFISKWLSAVLYGGICLGVSFVFGGLTSVVLGQTDILSALAAFLGSIIPLGAAAAMASFFAAMISSPALLVFLSTVIYILLHCAGFISSFLGVIFYTAHMNWYKMFLGAFSFSLVNTFFMMAAYTAIFLITGNIIFSNKKV